MLKVIKVVNHHNEPLQGIHVRTYVDATSSLTNHLGEVTLFLSPKDAIFINDILRWKGDSQDIKEHIVLTI